MASEINGDFVENRFYDKKTRLQKGIWMWNFFAHLIEKALPITKRTKKVVSEVRNPLLLIPAIELAAKIRKKEVNS